MKQPLPSAAGWHTAINWRNWSREGRMMHNALVAPPLKYTEAPSLSDPRIVCIFRKALDFAERWGMTTAVPKKSTTSLKHIWWCGVGLCPAAERVIDAVLVVLCILALWKHCQYYTFRKQQQIKRTQTKQVKKLLTLICLISVQSHIFKIDKVWFH